VEVYRVKEVTCCFTGHRHLLQDQLPDIARTLESVIRGLVAEGVVYYGCGGAVGFDQLAGETVLKLKKQFPCIKLIMVLPCADQGAKWRLADKARYRALLDSCDKRVYIGPPEQPTTPCTT